MSFEQPQPQFELPPNNPEPFPQQLERRSKMIIDEQQLLLPPNNPEPFPLQPPPQNKRIRIKKIQLLPPKEFPQPQPQLDKSPMLILQISFYNTIIRKEAWLCYSKNKIILKNKSRNMAGVDKIANK